MTPRFALLYLVSLLLVVGCGEAPKGAHGPEADVPAGMDVDALPGDADTALDAGDDAEPDAGDGDAELDATSDEVDADDLADLSDTTDAMDPADATDAMDASDTSPEDTTEPLPDSATFTIASWNANYNNSVANVVSHTRDVINADVVGFQELGGKTHAANIIEKLAAVVDGKGCPECEYRAYFPTGGRAWPGSIIWRKSRFKLIDKGHIKAHDPVDTNDCPGARNHHLTKSLVWVILEERTTGARFMVSNNHLVASVEANGRWKPCAGPVRKKLFTDHMDRIVDTIEMAKNRGLPIFVTGDFNVNYRADQRQENRIAPFPYARLGKHNVFANWYFLGMENGAGTHGSGSRLIDYVHMSRAPKKLEPLSQRILGKGGSDHNAVRVRVRLFR